MDLDAAHWDSLAAKHFGIARLRPGQNEVLARLSEFPAVLATLPTGFGKTLLYALPALALTEGLIVVVCPLISLMRDQMRRMQEADIPSVLFTSEQTDEEKRASLEKLYDSKTRLVFVSPERFVSAIFLRKLKRTQVRMVVVDEAHCVMMWGTAFRPEYMQIGEVLEELKPEKVLALTATASAGSRKYIREFVFPKKYKWAEIVGTPVSENVFVEAKRVYSEDEKWVTLLSILNQTKFQKAIVYFPKRSQCDTAAAQLKKLGMLSISYHAGMTRAQRLAAEEYITQSKGKVVVCATQAFGMGVNISDISLVVVFGFPGSIEEYFQMIGRAGRSGQASHSVIIWSGSDPKRRFYQFEESFPALSKIEEHLGSLSAFWPGENQSTFQLETSLASRLNLKKQERTLPGIISAFRLLGALDMPLYKEDYIEIEMAKTISVQDLLLQLPQGPTRRRRVLDSLCQMTDEGWRTIPGAKLVVTVAQLLELARLNWRAIGEVLGHFEQESKLRVKYLDEFTSRTGFIFKGSIPGLRQGFVRYNKMRTNLQSGLNQLEKLVETQNCRLAASRIFFDGKPGAQSKSYYCMQCDRCAAQNKITPAHLQARRESGQISVQ